MDLIKSKKSIIASRLRLSREQSGLSQSQVANMIDVHRPTISEIVAGRRNVTVDELSMFSKIYDVDIDWLICTDVKSINKKHDKLELAARELTKLKDEDLQKILSLLAALRSSED
jgi:transcriptional regulator with XRE-family HTH domain